MKAAADSLADAGSGAMDAVTTDGAAGRDPWTDAMRRGDWAAAWTIADAALAARRGEPCWHWPRHLQYLWDGTPLNEKRVLIRCYHGLGDTVQFIRYAPLVREIARETIVWAQPALLPLLREVAGIDRLLPLHDGTPEVGYDVDVESMELAHVFRTTPARVPEGRVFSRSGREQAGRGGGGALEVGIVWQAGGWDDRRSIPFAELGPLLAVPGVRWHALQRGPALAEWPAGFGVIDGADAPEIAAAAMRRLDLVISVDSFPAHLAGAAGVRTWTLLQADADWRWMEGREDTPWYPTMRLLRQRRAGEWREVLAQVVEELRRLAER